MPEGQRIANAIQRAAHQAHYLRIGLGYRYSEPLASPLELILEIVRQDIHCGL
jgi:hypothetical protein